MDANLRKLFESMQPRPGKCGFVTQLQDMNGIMRKCVVRYDRRVTDTKILVSNVTVHFNGQDVTCFEAVHAKLKAIEARCMCHAEQDARFSETILQTVIN